jgi:hypothetical protein
LRALLVQHARTNQQPADSKKNINAKHAVILNPPRAERPEGAQGVVIEDYEENRNGTPAVEGGQIA